MRAQVKKSARAMATEQELGDSPSSPEEAAGVSEKIKDMEELSSLEDEKIR